MGSGTDILIILLVAWGAITVVLIAMLIYRGILTTREDDELIIDQAEAHIAREQQAIVAKIARLSTPITILSVGCGALGLLIFGMWVWRGINQNF
jgi:hypothetical protein